VALEDARPGARFIVRLPRTDVPAQKATPTAA
jgi:hypothetical protein